LASNKALKMQIIVYGTPAEESGCGKILMIENGAFDEVEICMMSHPAPYEIPTPKWLSIGVYNIIFTGN